VVCVNAPDVYVNAVFEMSVQEVNGETDLCHFTTVPTFPDKVSNPLELPEHIDVPPETDPPLVVGETVTVVEVEFAVGQLPRCTTALN
jgi:hypothetical protein